MKRASFLCEKERVYKCYDNMSGMSGRLCPLHHGQEAGHVCPLKSRPEGEDEANRLPKTSGQGKKCYIVLDPIPARNSRKLHVLNSSTV